jgi:Mn-containing catalase
MPTDANGVPFDGSRIVATGNLAADTYANIMAESGGRLLATRLYELTDDPGMEDMLAFLIARDTMDHNQSISILKDLGDPEELLDVHPIPESFPDEVENQEFNYQYRSTNLEPQDDPGEPWTSGEAPDMEGEFTFANKHDLEGVPINVPQADPRTYNDPTPEGED